MGSFPETLIDPRLRLHGTGRIFDRLKNLTGNFVHTGAVQFFRSVHTELTNQVEF